MDKEAVWSHNYSVSIHGTWATAGWGRMGGSVRWLCGTLGHGDGGRSRGNALRLGTLSRGRVALFLLWGWMWWWKWGGRGRGRRGDIRKEIFEEPRQELVYPGPGHAPQPCRVNLLEREQRTKVAMIVVTYNTIIVIQNPAIFLCDWTDGGHIK